MRIDPPPGRWRRTSARSTTLSHCGMRSAIPHKWGLCAEAQRDGAAATPRPGFNESAPRVATGGVFRSGGTPPSSTRAQLIRTNPVNAIAMLVSFRPLERSCAASPATLCCHHLRKSSTSRVRGSSASTVEAPLPGGTCNCAGDLTSSGLVDSLPIRARSRVFGAPHDRAGCGRRDEDSVARGKLDGASFRPVLCTPSRKRRSNSPGLICGAGPNPETPRSILIERKRRAGILTPQVILRQCSSRRGKHSMWGLVQLSRQRCEAVPLRPLYDPGLDLQLTPRRALRAPRRPALKALATSVRGADNMSDAHLHIHGVVPLGP